MSDQGTYTATALPTDGTTIEAADVTTDLNGLINEFNKSVGSSKISDSSITTAKIADSNVTTAKIADSNVTTAKINDGAVTAAKMSFLYGSTEASSVTLVDSTWVDILSFTFSPLVASFVQLQSTTKLYLDANSPTYEASARWYDSTAGAAIQTEAKASKASANGIGESATLSVGAAKTVASGARTIKLQVKRESSNAIAHTTSSASYVCLPQ